MNETLELELKNLWTRLLGKIPSDQQWGFWEVSHTPAVIRQGILRATQKNLSIGGTMDDDRKLRFASAVMLDQTRRNEEHAANRERLRQEMEAR